MLPSRPPIFNLHLPTKLISFPAACIFPGQQETSATKQSEDRCNRKGICNEGLCQHHFMEAQSLCSTNTVLFASPHKVLASKNIINIRESKLLSTLHNWSLLIPPAGLKIIASLSQYKQKTELKASHFAFGSSLSKACQLSKRTARITHTLSKKQFPLSCWEGKEHLKAVQ